MKEEIRIKNKLEFDDFFKNSKAISNNYFVLYKKEKKVENIDYVISGCRGLTSEASAEFIDKNTKSHDGYLEKRRN